MATMKPARIATLVVFIVPCVVCTKTPNQPAAVLIRESRRLSRAEVVRVLEGSRRAIAGKALRLADGSGQPSPAVIMAANGRPRLLHVAFGFDGSSASAIAAWRAAGRIAPATGPETTHVDVIAITEYTGRAARHCDGGTSDGELVLDYEHHTPPDQWSVKARKRSEVEFPAVFDMLAGAIPLESGELRTIDSHSARAFIGPWQAPRDGIYRPNIPRSAEQSLWIDVESLLPVRWSIAIPEQIEGAATHNSLVFLYDGSIDIHAPEGMTTPECIP